MSQEVVSKWITFFSPSQLVACRQSNQLRVKISSQNTQNGSSLSSSFITAVSVQSTTVRLFFTTPSQRSFNTSQHRFLWPIQFTYPHTHTPTCTHTRQPLLVHTHTHTHTHTCTHTHTHTHTHMHTHRHTHTQIHPSTTQTHTTSLMPATKVKKPSLLEDDEVSHRNEPQSTKKEEKGDRKKNE